MSNNTSLDHRCKYYVTYGNISKPSEALRTPYQPFWPCTSSAITYIYQRHWRKTAAGWWHVLCSNF